jgi:putative transposase
VTSSYEPPGFFIIDLLPKTQPPQSEKPGKITLSTERYFAMKKTKFTEEQIAFALRQAETGTRAGEICRKMGISEATFYNWKKKYGGLGVSELRHLKQLEEENRKLKQLVADLSLDKKMLQDVLSKKL